MKPAKAMPSEVDSAAGRTAKMAQEIYGTDILRKGRLRLLRLYPDHVSSPICCDLIEESIDAELSFEALSYTWGTLSPRGAIRFCGHEWPVTTNLLSALRHLRSHREPRILWVDALCINQASNSERSQQVAQMPDIYSRAARVLAWLDEGSTQRNAGIKAIRQISRTPKAHWYAFGHDGEDNLEARDAEFGKWDWVVGIQEITTCSWWGRVWTLQEAVLARELLFVIGWHQISSETLVEVGQGRMAHAACCKYLDPATIELSKLSSGITNVLRLAAQRLGRRKTMLQDIHSLSLLAHTSTLHTPRLGMDSLQDRHDALIADYEDFVKTIQDAEMLNEDDRNRKSILFKARDELRDQFLHLLVDEDEQRRRLSDHVSESPFSFGKTRPLWTDVLRLVDECRSRVCSDSRDRVYGYSGLRSRLLGSSLPPDYSFPPYKVLEDFHLEIIRRSGSLDVFNLLGPWNAKRDVPWLLNLWNPETMPTATARERFEQLSNFQASGTTSSQVEFVYPGAVSVKGFIVGTVREVGRAHMVRSDAWRIYKEWWEMLGLDRCPSHPDRNGKPMSSVLCEILMGYSSAGAETVEQNALLFKPFLYQGIKGEEAAERGSKEIRPRFRFKLPSIFRSTSIRKTSPNPSSTDLFEMAKTATEFRQLIVSNHGHVGLANVGVEEGDTICIFFGGRTPFILRDADREIDGKEEYVGRVPYHIVGEAYIHGLMYGEGMEILRERSLSELDFLLI